VIISISFAIHNFQSSTLLWLYSSTYYIGLLQLCMSLATVLFVRWLITFSSVFVFFTSEWIVFGGRFGCRRRRTCFVRVWMCSGLCMWRKWMAKLMFSRVSNDTFYLLGITRLVDSRPPASAQSLNVHLTAAQAGLTNDRKPLSRAVF